MEDIFFTKRETQKVHLMFKHISEYHTVAYTVASIQIGNRYLSD